LAGNPGKHIKEAVFLCKQVYCSIPVDSVESAKKELYPIGCIRKARGNFV
jgi:hypothetical protein